MYRTNLYHFNLLNPMELRIPILVAFIHVMFLIGCHSDHEAHEEILKLEVTNPIRMDTTGIREFVCQIRSIQHIELRALERGYLQNIYVDEGQYVRKGQAMFQILPMLYEAELQKAQAEVNYAKIEYENTRQLADSNIVSKNELALIKAKYDKAKAELSLAQTHFNFTTIKAPFDGIMDRFQVRLGSLLDEGDLLTTLSDNSKMWVYFNVPEAEYLNYMSKASQDPDMKVQLMMANNELFKYPGIVETIEADFNNETGNIAFRATFPNPDKLLRHGETGNILMPVPLKNALIIPQKATIEILDKRYVFVVDENDVVQSRQISIGQELQHLYVVTEGLEDKDRVLIEGLRKVKNGQTISSKLVDIRTVLENLNSLHAE
jgi:membrane fusion protein (multidrug efflux system)